MKKLIFKLLEPLIQAVITERILKFYRGLVEAGQLTEVPGKLPRAD